MIRALGIPELLAQVPLWNDLPSFLRTALLGLLPAILILLAVVTPVGLLGVWAERRVSAWIQNRSGPNRVGIMIGPFRKWKWARLFGLGQSLADGVKLLGKEDFVPPLGAPILFLAAPLIVFAGSLGLFAVIPFSDGLQAIDPELGVFYALAVGAVEVVGVLMAGWASNNKWSLLGAMREVAQVVSYEIPMAVVALCPVIVVGSLQFSEIVDFQRSAPVDVWGLFQFAPFGETAGWMIFRAFPFNVIAMVIFYICSLAALKRAPFDLPECESELVSGFLTEYSGMRWGLFFLGEYAAMFALSAITATLFMGGWTGPVHALVGGEPGSVQSMIGGALEFTWKTLFWFVMMIMVRWTLPRLRLDQVMVTCYKYLVPFAMVCLACCALARVLS